MMVMSKPFDHLPPKLENKEEANIENGDNPTSIDSIV